MFTGNRGCLVDASGAVIRHHRGELWITCLTEYRGWRVPLARPDRWTPIFFLDDAVALAAGHRPCALCRREAYLSYREAVSRAAGADQFLAAAELNRLLSKERLRPGRGLVRAADRILWSANIAHLPAGTVIVEGIRPQLVLDDQLRTFGFGGWVEPVARPTSKVVSVLTPPMSVAALAGGYVAQLHPTALSPRSSDR